MSFPRYPAYKDSGVEWLGKLPTHWSVAKVKALTSRISSGKTPLGGSETYVDEGVLFLRSQNVYDDGLRLDDAVFISEATDESMAVSRVLSGDVLLNITGASIGRSCVVPAGFQPANVNQHVCAIRPKSGDVGPFLSWLFKSHTVKSQIDLAQNGAAREGLNFEQIGNISVPIAPPKEQAELTAFLDRETAKIDALVAEQEQLITLLKEKRQAVISHAVTKGLDPSVPMKESGVEWLGEVPAHWDIKRIGHILDAIGDVDHFMPESVDDGVPYLMTGDLKDYLSQVPLEDCKQVSYDDYIKLSKRIKSSMGDVVMARYATIGTLMYVDEDADFLVSYSCVTLKANCSKISGLYLFQFLSSDAFRQGIEKQVNTNTQGNVGIADLRGIKIALPPMEEQAAITAFLDAETFKLDATRAEAEGVVNLLKERRSALISAAVTGQIDVRQLAQ